MVESTQKPETIQLDGVKNGLAEILVHWDIEQIERETDFGTETVWRYEECAFRGKNAWVLPKAYITRKGILKYLTSIQDEILDWAQGSKVNL